MLFGVPALTMRLVSEEKRSGTLEVLMTTPTDEGTVVLSKFLAGFMMFLLMWLPFALFILAFRIMGESSFDYLPLLSFGIALLATGAAFTAMGVFFSSVTSNQIISAILTFAVMMVLTFFYMVKWRIQGSAASSNLVKNITTIAEHVTYLDLWISSFSGKLSIRQLLFQGSMAVWWLFLSVKVLEARRWT
jgi:ABC-type transport system involved in multi-copper enzyme maturation permease subunit